MEISTMKKSDKNSEIIQITLYQRDEFSLRNCYEYIFDCLSFLFQMFWYNL